MTDIVEEGRRKNQLCEEGTGKSKNMGSDERKNKEDREQMVNETNN